MLAAHLGLTWLRHRRIAWLALAAVTLTVAVPVLVLGVVQGFLDVTARQVRANESDLTVLPPWRSEGLPDSNALRDYLRPFAVAIGPSIEGWALAVPRIGGGDGPGMPCRIDGIDAGDDLALGRLAPGLLHKPPVTDLSAPDVLPNARGTGFITPRGRADIALAGLDIAAQFGAGMIPPPRLRAPVGVIAGRELLYGAGLDIGQTVRLVSPAGGRVLAEITDTIGTGVLEIDRFTLLVPLPAGQQLMGLRGKVGGYRLRLADGANLTQAARRLSDGTGLRVETWMDRRGNTVRSLELQRNIMALVMFAIQLITVFIVYAVFSTLVAEKRHDIGVRLGRGARRRDIAGAFLIAGGACCLLGGILGWGLGWAALAALNPLSRLLGIPLFPQDVIYTPEAPTSYDPLPPLVFTTIATTVGLIATAIPAWKAAATDPIACLREG